MSTAQKVIGALSPYGIKQVKPNEYQMNSPLRPNSDSFAFVLKIEGDEHGAFFDHVTEEKGSLYDLAKHLRIDVPTVTQVASTKRAYKDLDDYAIAHGITPDILKAAGWKNDTKNNRPALKFVTKGGDRWRFLDGNKPHYISSNGYKKVWYGLNETLYGRLSYGADLIICNGEISTIVGQAYGLAVCAVTAGEHAIPAELVAELKPILARYGNTKVVVALDCDEKGRKATDTIVKQLRNAGMNAVGVDLGLSKGGDLADWLTLYGLDNDAKAISSFRKLPEINIFEPTTAKRWKIVHASELANLPPVRWLIKNEIPDHALTVIFGASGVGKSFVTLDYALRVAQGGNVVYMAGEGESGYDGRIKAWCRHHHKTDGGLYLCLGAVSLLDNGDLEEFIYETMETCKNPKLIVVDTLARSMLGGDENSSRDMAQFIARCDMLKQRFGCAVIVVHHTSKAGIWERGSGSLRGASDAMIRVSAEDELIVIECSKAKDAQPFETMYRKLQPVDIGMMNEDGEVVMPMVLIETDRFSEIDQLSGLTRNQKAVLENIVEVFRDGFTLAELNELMPTMDRGNLHRILSRLKALKYIRQESKRDPYEVLEEGIIAVGGVVKSENELSELSQLSVLYPVSANDNTPPVKHNTKVTKPTIPTTETTEAYDEELFPDYKTTKKKSQYHANGY